MREWLSWESTEAMELRLDRLLPKLRDNTAAILEAIDRDPKLRFQSAAEFREAARNLPEP